MIKRHWWQNILSEPLPVGTVAPDFTLFDQDNHPVQLSFLRPQAVVLIFYPMDETSTCTRQLCSFRDQFESFQSLDMFVFGISPQDRSSHYYFRHKHNFPFSLLVDKDQQVATLYHCNGPLSRRTVYGIDGKGIIRFAQRGTPDPVDVQAALLF